MVNKEVVMRSRFGSNDPINGSDKARLLILAGLFFVLLLATVGVVFLYAGSSRATVKAIVVEKEPEVNMVDVLVPIENIDAGQALTPAMFRKESRPAVGLPSRVVHDFEEIKGLYSRSLIAADQPLHRDYITNIRPTNALTVKIPEGYRAVTISVDARSSVEGWARPGARVDVVWASKIQGRPAVTVIVQNAQVLSVEREMDNKTQNVQVPNTVTLLVTAEEAAKIQLAQTTGALSLNLRGDTDPGKADQFSNGSVTLDDLYPKNMQDDKPVMASGPKIHMRDPKTGKDVEYVFRDGELVPAQ